jgi:septum formation protein
VRRPPERGTDCSPPRELHFAAGERNVPKEVEERVGNHVRKGLHCGEDRSMRLILASASPRREELLRLAGFTFEVVPADVDERVLPGEAPAEYVRRLAAAKSAAVTGQMAAAAGDVTVLGADTAVVVDGLILGKPRDNGDAASMLRRLAGRSHEVMTGVSIRDGRVEVGAVVVTSVTFSPLSENEIAAYVASGEGGDKAGAYAIQGLASRFIPSIEGSYSNVVGLPVALVAELVSRLASGGESSYSQLDSSRKSL